jgi:hypothetical protein
MKPLLQALRKSRAPFILGLLWLALPIAGCKTSNTTSAITGSKSPYASKLSEAELRDKLAAFYVDFINSVELATSTAALKTDDLALRERLIQGRLRVARSCRQAVFQRNPMAAFVDTWSLCIQLEYHLDSPIGKEIFGVTGEPLEDATRRLREDIEDLGKLFLKPKELADVKQKLEAYAQAHPLTQQSDVTMPSSDQASGIPEFGWLINLPLSPFRAFEGVDQTAAAVREVAYVGAGFSRTADDLPHQFAWQSELLLLQSRREMEGLLNDLDQQQTNIQATVQQVRLAINDSKSVMAELERSLSAGKETAHAITEGANALSVLPGNVTAMLKEIHELYPPDTNAPAAKPPEPSRPFDILDYARTAQEISVAATNLSGLLVEVQTTVGANALTKRIQEVQSSAEATLVQTRKLANHIALLGVLLILAFFTALFIYRLLLARIKKTGTASA